MQFKSLLCFATLLAASGVAHGEATFDLQPSLVTPTDGSTVSSINNVFLVFKSATYCLTDGGVTPDLTIQLMKKNGPGADQVQYLTTDQISPSEGGPSYMYTLAFNEETDGGTYQVYIPQGVFCNETYKTSNGEDGNANPEITIEYTIPGASDSESDVWLLPATITPNPEENVDGLSVITLTFGEIASFPPENTPEIKVYSVGDSGNSIVDVTYSLVEDDWFKPMVYTITLSSKLTAGKYQIVFPEGLFYDEEYNPYDDVEGGKISPEFVVTYVVDNYGVDSDFPQYGGVVAYDIVPASYSPTDGSTVDELSTIEIDFDTETFTVVDEDSESKLVVLYEITDDGEEQIDAQPVAFNMNVADFYLHMIVTFSSVTKEGNYKVVIPKGTFCDGNYNYVNGSLNPEIVLYYAVSGSSGVESIVEGAETITVYDVNGVQILKDADVDAAKELKSGLYIINGKKVMVRK